MSGQPHVPAALPSRKVPLYPLCGWQKRSGCFVKEKNTLPLDIVASSLGTILIELSLLRGLWKRWQNMNPPNWSTSACCTAKFRKFWHCRGWRTQTTAEDTHNFETLCAGTIRPCHWVWQLWQFQHTAATSSGGTTLATPFTSCWHLHQLAAVNARHFTAVNIAILQL